eukprot:CAMPEP_0168526974 /NCGR_PEP_ID=MMETSP0405-20121227/12311_1 /TAXON_ID=498012 /ORGANISM="Trichosphaerium sp, Strain Am-I-7 wt" /LENGTH=166 /DNA_ID=CAMNT_0008549967 /DNA_START=233 /DNA_END=733 /DNA_ORIENTATION=-
MTTPFPMGPPVYSVDPSFEASGVTADASESLVDVMATPDLTDSCIQSGAFLADTTDTNAKFEFTFTSTEYEGPGQARVTMSATEAASYRIYKGDDLWPFVENTHVTQGPGAITVTLDFPVTLNTPITISIQPFGAALVGNTPTVCFESAFEVVIPCTRRITSVSWT